MAKTKLSPAVQNARRRRLHAGAKLVHAFDEAAQVWGWVSDQASSPEAVKAAEEEHRRTRTALLDYLERNVK